MRTLPNISLLLLWSHLPSSISCGEGMLLFPVACNPPRQWQWATRPFLFSKYIALHSSKPELFATALDLVFSQSSQVLLNCKELSSKMKVHLQTAHVWKAFCTHLEELLKASGKAVQQGLLSWFKYCSVALKLQDSLQRWGAAKTENVGTDGSWKAVAGLKMIYC